MFGVTYLKLDDFKIICQELEHFFNQNKDPAPVYEQTYFDKLDSIINTPYRTFDKKEFYDDIYKKAACYFYFVNKIHPFNNGNKRVSIVSTGVFLLFNNIEFTAGEEMMYEFAKSIAVSKKNQEFEFEEVVEFIKANSQRVRVK